MTPEQLDTIEARANAATPGPWEEYGEPEIPLFGAWGGSEADLAFIAAAREDIPVLIAEIRRLRLELGRLSSLADDAFDALGWDDEENPDA